MVDPEVGVAGPAVQWSGRCQTCHSSRAPTSLGGRGKSLRPSNGSLPAPEPVDVASKTVVPHVRPGTVPRPGLVNRLRAASDHRLVTLVAPAGYGKTTLLSQWVERDDRPLAWVSLDDGDDGDAVFRCVVAALSRIGSLHDLAHEGFASGRRLRPTGLPRLSCVLSQAPEPFLLVVDDVHAARSSASAAVLATLVRHMPEGSTLALSGRMLPELPIARLRTEGRVLEVGVEELALGRRDAQRLLRVVRAELDEADAAELWERTEGWAAGLHLAGLVLRDGTGRRRAVSEFTGEDRFVADYFRLEHLSRLDQADIGFLTRSSILESMCGPLCDVVVGGAVSRQRGSTLWSGRRSSSYRSTGTVVGTGTTISSQRRSERSSRDASPSSCLRCTAGPRCGARPTAPSMPPGGTRPRQET